MKYNSHSPYERPLSECPAKCAGCEFCKTNAVATFCTANGCREVTHEICDPRDRALPAPLNCPWWYANNVWRKLSPHKIAEIKEERAHAFVFAAMSDAMPHGPERKALISHYFRPGGGRVIDFTQYPEARALYEDFLRKENAL